MTDKQKWKEIVMPKLEEREAVIQKEQECVIKTARFVSQMGVSVRSAERILNGAVEIIRATADTQKALEILGDTAD